MAGPVPAHQRLGGHDRTGLEVDDRLIVDHQLVALEGLPKSVEDVEPVDGSILHGQIEEGAAVLAALLDPVHREVRAPQELLGVERVLRHGDPDARGHHDLFAAQAERRIEQPADALGRGQGVVEAADALEQHRELVTAEAGDGVRRARRVIDPRGCRRDQLVATRMSEAVIDELEVVEVDHQHGDPLGRAEGPVERMACAVLEQRAIRDAGERIREGLLLELAVLLLQRARHPVEALCHLV